MDPLVPGQSLVSRPASGGPRYLTFFIFALGALFVACMVAYEIFFPHTLIRQSAMRSDFFTLYIAPRADKTSTWLDYENGQLTQHAPPAPGTITGITQAGGAVYFAIGTIKSPASTVYRFMDGSYSTAYSDSTHQIQQISVSADGSYLGMSGVGSTTSGTSVVNLDTHVVTSMGRGTVPPLFLSRDGLTAALYAEGNSLYIRVLMDGVWSKPLGVYKSIRGSSLTIYTTDEGKRFAFREPDLGNVQEWQVNSLNPVVVSPVSIHAAVPPAWLVYSRGKLYGYTYAPDKGQTNTYRNLSLTDFSTGKIVVLTPPASLDNSAGVFVLPLQ